MAYPESMTTDQPATGVWTIPLELSNTAVGHVIAYAVDTGDGVVLVDTGWRDPGVRDALIAALRRGPGMEISDLAAVVVTHFHADHCGMAATLQSDYGLPVWMHRLEDAPLFERSSDGLDLDTWNRGWLTSVGVPVDEQDVYVEIALELAGLGEYMTADRWLAQGDILGAGAESITVHHLPGHTPGHIGLVSQERRVLLAGDVLLPHMSASVMWLPGDSTDPIGNYLQSLRRIQSEWPALRVLPGHGSPFEAPDQRAQAVLDRLDQQLTATEGLVESGARTPWDVARAMPWSGGWAARTDRSRRAALAQTHAFLVHLEAIGRVSREPEAELYTYRIG